MIGLGILVVIVSYVWLSKTIVNKVYMATKSLIKKRIAIAIFILIPSWDIIIGYPIYKYLCMTQVGVKIYKNVDNVEGFYVGEDLSTYGNIPPLPYRGYRYIDYKNRTTNAEPYKYYRVSWVDANTTQECIQIGNASSEYNLNLYKRGKCIIKEEIKESEMSQWEYIEQSNMLSKIDFINMRLDSTFSIVSTKNQAKIAEVVRVVWQGGWLYGFLSSIPVGDSWKVQCPKIIEIQYDEFLNKTLKPKQGILHGNN